MELKAREIESNRDVLREKGYKVYGYDREAVARATLEEPIWIHFGAGNIFRGFPAVLQEELLERGLAEKGIIVCEAYDTQIIDKVYAPFDNLSIDVTLKASGDLEKRVVGSVVEALKGGDAKIAAYFMAPSLQMVSFTITEKGYRVSGTEKDFDREPALSESLMGQLTYLCYLRYQKGAYPLALVSLDNCSKNGEKLYEALKAFAANWIKKGKMEAGFMDYLEDNSKLAFPWSMIDKITPQPNQEVKDLLEQDDMVNMAITKTDKNTWIAPFVNTEEKQYLVIEDTFPNGRPALEAVGVKFTDRETVNKVEKMKVGTCLNPLHTALAIFGCLLGYERIYEEMRNPHLLHLVEKLGYEEGLPVVVNPQIIVPKMFIDGVIKDRLPNPFIPDSPWRIIADTSQKLPIRFGETLKSYAKNKPESLGELKYIPLVFAGWCRYLMGVNDKGETYEVGPDPLAGEAREIMKDIQLGQNEDIHEKLKNILNNEALFGMNLYEAGLGEKVEAYFEELNGRLGAVAEVLERYCE